MWLGQVDTATVGGGRSQATVHSPVNFHVLHHLSASRSHYVWNWLHLAKFIGEKMLSRSESNYLKHLGQVK